MRSSQFELFSDAPSEDMLEVGAKGGEPSPRRTFAEENHEEAQQILRALEHRAKRLGAGHHIGRIWLGQSTMEVPDEFTPGRRRPEVLEERTHQDLGRNRRTSYGRYGSVALPPHSPERHHEF